MPPFLEPAAWLQAVVRDTDDAVITKSLDGIIQSWNPSAARIFGWTEQEAVGQPITLIIPPELWPEEAGILARLRAGERVHYAALTRVRKDGTRIQVALTVSPVCDGDGRVVGASKIVRDITEQVRTQAAAAQRAELLDLAHEPILIRDAQDRITYWNKGAERLYGYSASEACGHVSHQLLKTAFPAPLETVLENFHRDGHWYGQLQHFTKSGDVVTVESRWVCTAQGVTLETNFDVTGLQRAQAKLRELSAALELRVEERTRELRETNQDLEAFSYSVSHDLRSPLRAIQGFADALLEDYSSTLDDTARTYLEQIESGGARMTQLIDDLLAYSRLGRASLEIRPVRLADSVRAAIAQLALKCPISVDVSPQLAVLADSRALTQVLANLLSNACKFVSHGEPQVQVRTETHEGWVRTCVLDHGIGIDAEHQERIFRVFERLHGQESYPGTGIGLSIVKRAVERMGGAVGVISSLGQGSQFWIDLPKAETR